MPTALSQRLRDVLNIFGLSRRISIGEFDFFVFETSNLEFCLIMRRGDVILD